MHCDGKRQYKSLREAKRVRNIREKDGRDLRIYHCPECFNYHLTKKWEYGKG